MIRTLSGPNGYQLLAAQRRVVQTFVDEYGDMALERLDGSEAEYDRIREALTSVPFLSPKKLVILSSPGANKQFSEAAPDLLPEVSDTTDVLLIEPKLDKRSVYYKYLKKTTQFNEYTDMDAAGLASYLVQAAGEQGGKLAQADARYLVERIGTDQQRLTSELSKLLLYRPQIDRETIDLLTELAPQSTVFELLEAALGGRQDRALSLYAEQRALKVEPQQIIAMLVWQMHVLAIIAYAGNASPDQIAKDAKLSPYVVRKSQPIARRLGPQRIRQLVAQLTDIDVRSKHTALDVDAAVQNFLLQLGA